MRGNVFFLLAIGFVLISSCSLKVPEPQDSMKGIVAIPMDIKNFTAHNLSYYYKFISTIQPGVFITVFPNIGTEFAFSNELSPGKYYFDQVKMLHNSPKGINIGSTKPRPLKETLIFNVQPNTVTISYQKLVVTQKHQEDPKTHRKVIYTNYRLVPVTISEMAIYENDLRGLENSNKWKIASGPSSFSPQNLSTPLNGQQQKDILIALVDSEFFVNNMYDQFLSENATDKATAKRFIDCVQHEVLQLIQNTPAENFNVSQKESSEQMKQWANQAAVTCRVTIL